MAVAQLRSQGLPCGERDPPQARRRGRRSQVAGRRWPAHEEPGSRLEPSHLDFFRASGGFDLVGTVPAWASLFLGCWEAKGHGFLTLL